MLWETDDAVVSETATVGGVQGGVHGDAGLHEGRTCESRDVCGLRFQSLWRDHDAMAELGVEPFGVVAVGG